jgi:hypothetical protein
MKEKREESTRGKGKYKGERRLAIKEKGNSSFIAVIIVCSFTIPLIMKKGLTKIATETAR